MTTIPNTHLEKYAASQRLAYATDGWSADDVSTLAQAIADGRVSVVGGEVVVPPKRRGRKPASRGRR